MFNSNCYLILYILVFASAVLGDGGEGTGYAYGAKVLDADGDGLGSEHRGFRIGR